jgi:hypothetical protein
MFILSKVAPSNKAVVILNASEKDKIVNNLTVMTNVSTAYAPAEKCWFQFHAMVFDYSDQELAQKN